MGRQKGDRGIQMGERPVSIAMHGTASVPHPSVTII
jgi:hypothetical protein